jgi:hypothetical protein
VSVIRVKAKEIAMGSGYEELTLQSALSDPLIRSIMAADNVDPVGLELMLRRIAEEVVPRQSQQSNAARAWWA